MAVREQLLSLKPPPDLIREVASFLRTYDGPAISLRADCDTQVWLNDEGDLCFMEEVFDEEPSWAVLNLARLLPKLEEIRAETYARLVAQPAMPTPAAPGPVDKMGE